MREELLPNVVFAVLLILFVFACFLPPPGFRCSSVPQLAASVCTPNKCNQPSLDLILKVTANVGMFYWPCIPEKNF